MEDTKQKVSLSSSVLQHFQQPSNNGAVLTVLKSTSSAKARLELADMNSYHSKRLGSSLTTNNGWKPKEVRIDQGPLDKNDSRYCNRTEVTKTSSSLKPNLMKFVAINPKLSTVNLDLGMGRENPESNIDVPVLNAFIKSFKDTIQEFIIDFTLSTFITGPLLKIPPMRCLKSISLICCSGYNEDVESDYINLRAGIFEFEKDISAENYFPKLKTVSLHAAEDPRHVDASLMSFFAFKSSDNKDRESVWGSMPKVEILKIIDADEAIRSIRDASEQPPIETALFSEMFPNILILKIGTDDAQNLASSWWGISLNVEFIEIDGLECNSNDDVELSLLVDKFFTGFSLDMCMKLRKTELPQEILNNPELLNFLRVDPSVCDLRKLKELKVRLTGELSTEFATHVTGAYAFSKMPNTKCIISYSPDVLAFNRDRDRREEREKNNYGVNNHEGGNQFVEEENPNNDNISAENNTNADGQNKNVKNFDAGDNNNKENDEEIEEIAKYEELCFGSIKSYVHIVHETPNSFS